MIPVKQSVPNPRVVAYHLGYLYVQDQEGTWYVDDLSNEPVKLHLSFVSKRFVLGASGLLLLAEHGIAEVKGLEFTEWLGLGRAWAPLGWPMDGNRTVYGQNAMVRDREEVHGFPMTSTKTWWMSGQFGLKGSFPVVGGKPAELRWVFGSKKPFVYWHGILGELQFGEPPEVGIPYGEGVPIVGAQDRYYFSRDGYLWLMRRVEGWTFATRRGLMSYLPDGQIIALKGIP